MKKSKWTSYFWKLTWLVGLIVLAIISLNIVNHFKQMANDTFNFIPLLWSNLFISMTFGIYIALIFIKKWSLKFNPALLWCVSIPCILISFCYSILATFSSIFDNLTFSFIPYWLIRISTIEVFGIVAGLTLILSIFSSPSKSFH
ncbi:hypothetical protein [Schinkia azotoformans]|uniref:hypothetical protein n=1 Tax=Schinkia azotoformans TaxID=1454 RepID=UPI002DB7DD93|nr:hypothetical protein [Schinkia azotoformans]MEC1697915.1 hypothetical protein [Schinkia azotoformans]MEC1725143.1 hypothetical protein [Schinkia azotoformans]MEC1781268.1 hypothetical protein [Schinkia azotoformans]MED4330604.1 hypothetical protein [Schinkia azotoformans]